MNIHLFLEDIWRQRIAFAAQYAATLRGSPGPIRWGSSGGDCTSVAGMKLAAYCCEHEKENPAFSNHNSCLSK